MGCEYFQDKTNIKWIKLDKDHSPIYYGTMNKLIKTTNPYSGQSAMLTPEEKKLYQRIKHLEMAELYDEMQQALSKFSRLNPKAYMTLLD